MSSRNFDGLMGRAVTSHPEAVDCRRDLCVCIPHFMDKSRCVIPRGEQSFWDFYRDMNILERVQRNSVKRYLLCSPECEQTRSNRMPYVIVNHLIEKHGMQTGCRRDAGRDLSERGGASWRIKPMS